MWWFPRHCRSAQRRAQRWPLPLRVGQRLRLTNNTLRPGTVTAPVLETWQLNSRLPSVSILITDCILYSNVTAGLLFKIVYANCFFFALLSVALLFFVICLQNVIWNMSFIYNCTINYYMLVAVFLLFSFFFLTNCPIVNFLLLASFFDNNHAVN